MPSVYQVPNSGQINRIILDDSARDERPRPSAPAANPKEPIRPDDWGKPKSKVLAQAISAKRTKPNVLSRQHSRPSTGPAKPLGNAGEKVQRVQRGNCTWCGRITVSADVTIHEDCADAKERVQKDKEERSS